MDIEALRDLDSVAQLSLCTCLIGFQICPAGIVLKAYLATVQIGFTFQESKLQAVVQLWNGQHMNCALEYEREEEVGKDREREEKKNVKNIENKYRLEKYRI